jgi:hypothetical protein
MKIAVDIDGTIDANPNELRSIMGSLIAAGHYVVVLTGTSGLAPTQSEWQEKRNYLSSLGCGSVWNELVIVDPTQGDTADLKANYCVSNGVDVLIDNNKDNAKAATTAGVPLVLVPWASRTS